MPGQEKAQQNHISIEEIRSRVNSNEKGRQPIQVHELVPFLRDHLHNPQRYLLAAEDTGRRQEHQNTSRDQKDQNFG